MVRAEIQEHEVAVVAAALHAPLLGAEAERLGLGLVAVVRQREDAHLGRARRMLLAERMTFPRRRHQEPPQALMTLERDAEHVPDFSLVPARGRPEPRYARHRRPLALERDLDSQILVPPVGEEVIDDREVARRLAVAVLAQPLVDRG